MDLRGSQGQTCDLVFDHLRLGNGCERERGAGENEYDQRNGTAPGVEPFHCASPNPEAVVHRSYSKCLGRVYRGH